MPRKDNNKSLNSNRSSENFFISDADVQLIRDLPIEEVIKKAVPDLQLKLAGRNLIALCPFHNEKTPSFSISPERNLFKCFGCGIAGDSITFVEKHKKLTFSQACMEIAAAHAITLQQHELSNEEAEQQRQRDAIFNVNTWAAGWFASQLKDPKNTKAEKYLRSRDINDESIETFGLGYAPEGWTGLLDAAKAAGYKEDHLLSASLIARSEKDGKIRYFDLFRGRIIFPVHDHLGRVTGFAGRSLKESNKNSGNEQDHIGHHEPKYLNSSETLVYNKSAILYGLHHARRTIRETKNVYLVEGYFDVIRLHQIGITATVATCGTALTSDHIGKLSSIVEVITLISDNDPNGSGQKAADANGRKIIDAGKPCQRIPLPEDPEMKHDPDSFFTSNDQFLEYEKQNKVDFIINLVRSKKENHRDPHMVATLKDDAVALIVQLPVSFHDVYIEQLGSIIKPKKSWQDLVKAAMDQRPKQEDEGYNIPKNISLGDFEKYGFYEDRNCYFFKNNSGIRRGSNFVMEPLFHIPGVINAKRLYKITNEFGHTEIIELQQKDLTSLANFRLRIESLGNFLFEGSETELMKLKRSLYEKTLTATEVVQMGWQRQGFWAWNDGIFDGEFRRIDDNGIVSFKERYYYLPFSSKQYQGEYTLNVSERKFAFTPGEISFHDFAEKLFYVYGDNGMIGLCFLMATLFRDVIYKRFGFFPILNLFGPKDTGKTELALLLLRFFGKDQDKGPNLSNTTRPALADHVALYSNAPCHIDEFRNDVGVEKIEFCKGGWDGTGRTRMNMDKDRKKETTPVDSSFILSGQHMPNADIALFTRLVFLSFSKNEFTNEEKEAFNELRDLSKKGLCHLTHEILLLHDHFISTFFDSYDQVVSDLSSIVGEASIEERIFNNWTVIIASFHSLMNDVAFPWDYQHLIRKAAQLMIAQNGECHKGNEDSIFWSIVQYLVADGLIRDRVDFCFKIHSNLITDKLNEDTLWMPPKKILYLNPQRVFQLYRSTGNRTNENILGVNDIQFYLQNSKAYLGKKKFNFYVEENKRIIEDSELLNQQKTGKRNSQRAWCFDYDMLNISIESTDLSDVSADGHDSDPEIVLADSSSSEQLPF